MPQTELQIASHTLIRTNKILLTVAIPTFNRANYLALNLEQLLSQMPHVESGSVEIFVSDNCSSDQTHAIVQQAIERGLPLRYHRNAYNIGSDANIATCFNEAYGDYVLILGDDDVLVNDSLVRVCDLLRSRTVGVLSMKAYGYEVDFRQEFPGNSTEKTQSYDNAEEFLERLGMFATLISANVIAKHLMADTDATKYVGTNLVQTYLVYKAMLRGRTNVYVEDYLVACKRNNSNDYAFSEIFVERYGAILDMLVQEGISPTVIRRLERRMLLGYYPFYVWRMRKSNHQDLRAAWARFWKRFGHRTAFWVFVAPILKLPRPFALVWGACAILVGRGATGDMHRGASYARDYLRRRFSAA